MREARAAVAMQDFSVGNIVNCEHMIPEIVPSSTTGDGSNERCIVNSHIDLANWIDVNNW